MKPQVRPPMDQRHRPMSSELSFTGQYKSAYKYWFILGLYFHQIIYHCISLDIVHTSRQANSYFPQFTHSIVDMSIKLSLAERIKIYFQLKNSEKYLIFILNLYFYFNTFKMNTIILQRVDHGRRKRGRGSFRYETSHLELPKTSGHMTLRRSFSGFRLIHMV